jgi:hypothetical protein
VREEFDPTVASPMFLGACAGKSGYASRREALKIIKLIERRRRKPRGKHSGPDQHKRDAYLCAHCHTFHIGRKID